MHQSRLVGEEDLAFFVGDEDGGQNGLRGVAGHLQAHGYAVLGGNAQLARGLIVGIDEKLEGHVEFSRQVLGGAGGLGAGSWGQCVTVDCAWAKL